MIFSKTQDKIKMENKTQMQNDYALISILNAHIYELLILKNDFLIM